MRNWIHFIFCLPLVLATSITFANTPADDAGLVKEAYNTWVKTVESAKGNATEVAALYAPNAVLLPTLSPQIKIKLSNDTSQELYDFTSSDIRAYFVEFTKLKDLKTQTEKLYTQIFNDVAVNTGLYTFEYLDDKGNKVDVPARFTFVYEKINGNWLIINHHSSYLPEAH